MEILMEKSRQMLQREKSLKNEICRNRCYIICTSNKSEILCKKQIQHFLNRATLYISEAFDWNFDRRNQVKSYRKTCF